MMKFIDEFRRADLVKELLHKIKSESIKKIKIMEVCGGHTMAIHKFGIKSLLPDNIQLVSGPGCPVCVTDIRFIDTAISLARLSNTIIATFGDLIRVPGSTSNLNQEKAKGARVQIIFSPLDALLLAEKNPDFNVVLLGIGFETTAPGTAVALQEAKAKKIKNFFVLSAHKVMPPAMKALIDEEVGLNGYLAPGHVSVVTGSGIYDFIADKYKIPVVISGFEPVDILKSIYHIVQQFEEGNAKVENQYQRAVNPGGNPKAQLALNNVFKLRNDWWRGLGVLPNSGLNLNNDFSQFDAEKVFSIKVEKPKEPKNCLCGLVLKGIKEPKECPLFKKLCTPVNPVGACMVSNEGACHAQYRFGLSNTKLSLI
ncbi:MAG: hydrogenase formation protein HypD [Bacteroidales bacterium]|nr:hydrogenase formation protein HypD [Bacteroidales bacterium]